MKNILVTMIVALGISACGADGKIDVKPDTSGNGGSVGNGGSDAGLSTCECDNNNNGKRLKEQWITADDGSRYRNAFFWTDTADNDETCTFQSLPNGETRCVPPHAPMNAYQDSNCTIPVARFKVTECPPFVTPKYVRFDNFDYNTSDVCGVHPLPKMQFFLVGDLITPKPSNTWFLDNDGVCQGSGALSPDVRVHYAYPKHTSDFYVQAPNGGF